MGKKPMPSLLLKKLLSMFKKMLIVAAMQLIRVKLIARINHVELRNYCEKQIVPLEEVVDRLTDKDPNNAAQMQDVWLRHKASLETDTIALAIDIVKRKVKDDAIRTLVIAALESLDD
jgi:hypothetical protein